MPLLFTHGCETCDVAADDVLIERLLRVIDEGRRTATYKLALLLGLIDAAASSPGSSSLPTRLVAERVLDLYYPQTRNFVDAGGASLLPRQITVKSSPVLRAVERLRLTTEARGGRSSADAARVAPREYSDALDSVEDTFVRYPIPLLQVVGSTTIPFLYEVDWSEGTTAASLRRQGRDQLRLLDGVVDRLVVLGPILRPLIELHWVRDVARWSGIATEDEQLRSHLFGRERAAFPRAFVRDLTDLQDGSCFYCGDRLGKKVEVDHFLAWSRWPNDAIENLVVADRCNSAKSDHVAATAHLARWRLRLETAAGPLRDVAERHRWPTDPTRTWALTQSTYTHLAPGTPLWLHGREFELADGPWW